MKNKSITITGHGAVANTFLENPNNLPIINHKDGNKLNNCVDNLEWCSYSYNSYHSCHILGNKPPINCEKPVITKNVITGEIKEFKSISECAKYFKIDTATVTAKIKGKINNPTLRNTKLKGIYFKFKECIEKSND